MANKPTLLNLLWLAFLCMVIKKYTTWRLIKIRNKFAALGNTARSMPVDKAVYQFTTLCEQYNNVLQYQKKGYQIAQRGQQLLKQRKDSQSYFF